MLCSTPRTCDDNGRLWAFILWWSWYNWKAQEPSCFMVLVRVPFFCVFLLSLIPCFRFDCICSSGLFTCLFSRKPLPVLKIGHGKLGFLSLKVNLSIRVFEVRTSRRCFCPFLVSICAFSLYIFYDDFYLCQLG